MGAMGTTLCAERHQMVSLEGFWIRHPTTRNWQTFELRTNTVVFLGRASLSKPQPCVMASHGQRCIYTGKASSMPTLNNRFLSHFFILTLYLQPKDIQWCPVESWISWWSWYAHNPEQPPHNQLAVKLVRWPWTTYTAALHKGGNGISYEHNVL